MKGTQFIRSRGIRITLAIGISLSVFGLALLCTFRTHEISQLRRIPLQDALLKNLPLKIDAHDRTRLQALSASNALNADLITVAFIDLKTSAPSALARNEKLIELIKKFGWRSKTAQFAIMVDAAMRENGSDVTERIDALLRQNELVDYAFTFLSLIETNDIQRIFAVNLLSKKPTWATLYFTRPSSLATEDARLARFSTYIDLAKRNIIYKRADMGYSINALAENGQMDRAFKLWTIMKSNQPYNEPSDPLFIEARKIQSERGEMSTPFDWRLWSGIGYQTTFDQSLGLSSVRIEWDSRGVPIFITRTIRQLDGSIPELRISGPGASAIIGQALRMYVVCGDDTTEFNQTSLSEKADAAIFEAEKPVRCAFPELRIAGRPRNSTGSIDISITEISVIEHRKRRNL